jgi:flagellar assembly factor FliW
MSAHQPSPAAGEATEIVFDEGIIGVPRARRFELLERPGSQLRVLRSLDLADFALPVVDARVAEPGYTPSFQARVTESLSIAEGRCLVLAVVTLGDERSTANLRAPIVINVERRVGAQVILDDRSLPLDRVLDRGL